MRTLKQRGVLNFARLPFTCAHLPPTPPPTGGEPGVHVEHGGDPRADPPRSGGGALPLRQDHAAGPAGGADPS